MSAESIIEQLLADSDGILAGVGIDGAKMRASFQQSAAEERIERQRIAGIVQDALGNEAGRRFLVWLASQTVHLPMTDDELSPVSVERAALAGTARAARNGVFNMIQGALAWRPEDEAADSEAQ